MYNVGADKDAITVKSVSIFCVLKHIQKREIRISHGKTGKKNGSIKKLGCMNEPPPKVRLFKSVAVLVAATPFYAAKTDRLYSIGLTQARFSLIRFSL